MLCMFGEDSFSVYGAMVVVVVQYWQAEGHDRFVWQSGFICPPLVRCPLSLRAADWLASVGFVCSLLVDDHVLRCDWQCEERERELPAALQLSHWLLKTSGQ